MSQILVTNRLRPKEGVAAASVTIVGAGTPNASINGTTNSNGAAMLDTSKLSDGAYTLTVTPSSTSSDQVGPATASVSVPPERIFRRVIGVLNIVSGKITSATVSAGNQSNGDVVLAGTSNVTITLQPVWMKSPNTRVRGKNNITTIVVHHTGGPRIGPAINTFLSKTEQTSAHYVINADGLVVKMVQDTNQANQAGESHWAGVSGVNAVSIGIEIVNATGPYSKAQYTALLDLIDSLRNRFSTIINWNIIGHSDIATSNGVLGRKSSDPGFEFEWARLEDRGLGMRRAFGPFPPTIYGGFFTAFPTETLRKGDNDGKRIFGGTKRVGVAGDPVRELQNDLTTIGYFVGKPDGGFGDKTRAALHMLQEHFFAGKRGHKAPDGRLDSQTAQLVKGVVGAHP